MHVPGYEFLGPGTHIREKLSNNIKPINDLDEIARWHDIQYMNNTDRNHADEVASEAMINNGMLQLGKGNYPQAATSLLSGSLLPINELLRAVGKDFGKL